MKAADHGEDHVFDACNKYNETHRQQAYQSFVLPADVPGVGFRGDWVIKYFVT